VYTIVVLTSGWPSSSWIANAAAYAASQASQCRCAAEPRASRAGTTGRSHGVAARLLGLRSDYRGKQKDYLTYSALGVYTTAAANAQKASLGSLAQLDGKPASIDWALSKPFRAGVATIGFDEGYGRRQDGNAHL
jgi:hypothetical protein